MPLANSGRADDAGAKTDYNAPDDMTYQHLQQAGLPHDLLKRFLMEQMSQKLICAAVSGPHVGGYAGPDSPLEIKGVHVEPTENLVGLNWAPTSVNWVGEYEGYRVDFVSAEIGLVCTALLRGDGSILERILNPLQLMESVDLMRLCKVTDGVLSRRFYNYYNDFARGLLKDHETNPTPTVRRVLQAYRTALTGLHLLQTGELLFDLTTLARAYGQDRLEELMQVARRHSEAHLEEGSHWINHLARLHPALENSANESPLPPDPPNPAAVEEYLLDMRRRFFDAHTVQF